MDKREETVIRGSDSFEDVRGSIDNYYLSEPINWLGLITTKVEKEGVLRANHYHPEQEQKVLLISGSYISVYKDLLNSDGPIQHHLIKAGDLVVTPKNIAHAMIFLEDSTLINLVNGERKSENYGKHTIPYELVKPGDIEEYISQYKNEN